MSRNERLDDHYVTALTIFNGPYRESKQLKVFTDSFPFGFRYFAIKNVENVILGKERQFKFQASEQGDIFGLLIGSDVRESRLIYIVLPSINLKVTKGNYETNGYSVFFDIVNTNDSQGYKVIKPALAYEDRDGFLWCVPHMRGKISL